MVQYQLKEGRHIGEESLSHPRQHVCGGIINGIVFDVVYGITGSTVT